MSRLTGVITGGGDQRDVSLDALCQGVPLDALLAECRALDNFRRSCDNLYERVRALFFLYAIHRFHIPRLSATAAPALIPFAGFENLLERRFEEAIEVFLAAEAEQGASGAISSALAASYRALGRSAAACGACAATSGCSAPVTRTTIRSTSAPSFLPAIRFSLS